MSLDIDAPVQPIDPARDARRRAHVGALNRASTIGMLLQMAQPLAALGGGLVLGAATGAPGTGAIGMLLAWAAAWGVLYAAGMLVLVLHAPSLVRGLFGRMNVERVPSPEFDRSATAVLVLHVLAFTGFAMTTGVVAAMVGTGFRIAPLVLFGALGFVLGVSTRWTSP